MSVVSGQDASAAVESERASIAGSATNLIRDYAGLLTDDQVQTLESKAESISSQYGCNVYVLTVDSIGDMNRRDYAKQYYLENNLGYGDWRNGILFLVAMESRDYVTVTYGRNPDNSTDYGTGIYAFSDYGVSQMEDKVVPYLSSGDYNKAFTTYVDTCGSYLKQYVETGEPYDVGKSGGSIVLKLLITILVPLLIAFIVCMIFRAQMKTAVAATQADSYIPSDGFNLTRQIDQYTHTTQTRRTIERDHSSGGGSSVDSSGFGGSSGGKF